MGLDMYLYKKTVVLTKENNVDKIAEEVMYWRKANHIHKWLWIMFKRE
jgi:hypothetical protein